MTRDMNRDPRQTREGVSYFVATYILHRNKGNGGKRNSMYLTSKYVGNTYCGKRVRASGWVRDFHAHHASAAGSASPAYSNTCKA